MADTTDVLTRDRFAQLVRAGLPFNAVSGQEMVGKNLERLQRSMQSFGWSDPRFVTMAEARGNGWNVGHDAVSVEVLIRDKQSGGVENVKLYNASSVVGMPPLAAMLAMSESEISRMTEQGAAAIEEEEEVAIAPARTIAREVDVEKARSQNSEIVQPAAAVKLQPGFSRLIAFDPAPFEHDSRNSMSYFAVLENEDGKRRTEWGLDIERSLAEAGVSVGDAISLTRGGKKKVTIKERQEDGSFVEKPVDRFIWNTERQPVVQEQALPQDHSLTNGSTAAIEAPGAENGYAILAPYWVDGLHNSEGVTLAEQLNKEIKEKKITKDKEAIERLMSIHSRASELGLQVVTYERYRDDPHMKANLAQPRSLLDGVFVRDKEGAYRPAAGGRPVLVDKGDAVVLKSKDRDGYRAAMELAIAKGWTAIELNGKPSMLAEAWLEAKLKGLEVVNYVPNEKDKAKYAERIAQESAKKMQAESRAAEQTPEMVEVRPFVDADGKQKEARITYTVEAQGVKPQVYGNAKEAAQAFSSTPAASMPSVLRTVTRVEGGVVRPDTIAGTNIEPGKSPIKFVDEKLDQEFAEAVAQINEEERALSSLAAVAAGTHIGPIVAVEGNMIGQKTGRDANQITWHDIGKLNGRMPKLGEMAEIKYANGIGNVKEEPEQDRELAEGWGVER
ncbi:MAG TPA: LPD7 domain-containing protein [Noviherbaspirillum sp.]|nr:LPD7 domain-containing protein [Noviherbaspirillum sp.]